MTPEMTFGEAIEALREGKMVARYGWNGNGMFVFKQVPSPIDPDVVSKMTSLPQTVKDMLINRKQGPNYCNQMAIVKMDGTVDSWVASSSDTFAKDWYIVDPAEGKIPSYMVRLISERDQLGERVYKLREYLNGDQVMATGHKELLEAQLTAMLRYEDILHERIQKIVDDNCINE